MLSDNYFKNGLTFTLWIWVDKIEDQETQVIFDSRGPYESDDMSVSKSFHLWLKKGIFRLYIQMLLSIVELRSRSRSGPGQVQVRKVRN